MGVLDGKVAIVTGAGRGIGAYVCPVLARCRLITAPGSPLQEAGDVTIAPAARRPAVPRRLRARATGGDGARGMATEESAQWGDNARGAEYAYRRT